MEKEKVKLSPLALIAAAEGVCMLLIIIGVIVIKSFFPDTFVKVEKWYSENILTQTEVSEVLHGENDYAV